MLHRAEECGGSYFEAELQAAWWTIFHQRPENQDLAKGLCEKQAWELTRSVLLLTLL